MGDLYPVAVHRGRPTPHGVGGLKLQGRRAGADWVRRPTPHGVGGLKYFPQGRRSYGRLVPPLTGWVD